MNVQKAIIVVCSLATLFLMGYGGYLLWSNVRLPVGKAVSSPIFSPKQTTDAAKGSEVSTTSELSSEEKEAYQLYHYDLSLVVILLYELRHSHYPVATEAGWQDMLTSYQSNGSKKTLLDPRTGKPPVFTTTTPGVGEVQYTSPGGCAQGKPELIAGSSSNTFAYRAVVNGSVMCHSNTGGSVR